jgi:hypothetical protein
LLPAVSTPPGTGGFTFASRAPNGELMRFDPCEPIAYVVSGADPFPGAGAMIQSAIAEVSADSGLRFSARGATTETATPKREAYQPDRYGHTWAPVLIAWTDSTSIPDLKGRAVGLGGGAGVYVQSKVRLVSGIVYFDAPDLVRMYHGNDGMIRVRSVVLHELGHLVGLDHVNIKSDVMYPEVRTLAHYGPGDRRGLAQLGQGRCFNFV